MKKIFVIVISLFMVFLLTSCDFIEVEDITADTQFYTRSKIEKCKDTLLYGWQDEDYEIVALDYFYNNEKIIEKYGKEFDVRNNQVIMNNCEGFNFFTSEMARVRYVLI